MVNIATSPVLARRPIHVAIAANSFTRPKFFYGPSGVALAAGALEGIVAGISQMWISRSAESAKEKFQKVEVNATEVTKLARRSMFLAGFGRMMTGIATFIVGTAASRLLDVAMFPVRRAMCITWTLLMVGQTSCYYPVVQGKWSDKAKAMVQGHASIFGTIALFTIYGALYPEK